VKPTGVTYHVIMDGFAKLGKTAKMLEYWALMKQENRKRYDGDLISS
jgi:pentatricopeptide repeat protein